MSNPQTVIQPCLCKSSNCYTTLLVQILKLLYNPACTNPQTVIQPCLYKSSNCYTTLLVQILKLLYNPACANPQTVIQPCLYKSSNCYTTLLVQIRESSSSVRSQRYESCRRDEKEMTTFVFLRFLFICPDITVAEETKKK